MTTTSNTNPPAKTVQGLPEGTLRTTMTHVEVNDVVLVQPRVAGDLSDWVPAPAKPTKRAVWAKVYACGAFISVAVDGHAEAILLDYAPQTAITIRDREISEGPTVTITGTHVHPQGVPCGRVYDGDAISGVDTDAPADCPACAAQPMERVAGDGSVITVGSRVLVEREAANAGEESLVGTVTSLGDCYEGEWTTTVTVRHDGGRAYGYAAATLVAEDAAGVKAATVIPATAPKTEAQRRAIRLLGELSASGAQPQINGGTLKTLVRDGWVTIDTRPVRSVINLTADALAWLASEHTAEVTPHVLASGVTVYGATCNCGTGNENPRMARRVPWSSSMLTTAEDAIAVALGHGEVSRPRYASPEGAQTAADALLAAAEALAAHPMRGSRSTPARDAARAAYRDAMVTLRTAVGGAYPDVDAEAVISRWSMGDAPIADAVGQLRAMPEISVTDARITAVACGECGIMPHDMECPTGLRLDSPAVTARGGCGGCGADGDRHDADCLVAGEPLTAEDLAGLQPAESVVEAHNAGRPWSAKGAKRKGSSVAVKRQRQRVSAR